MLARSLMVVFPVAALACTSTPSFAQAGLEPMASSQELLDEPGFIMDSLVIPEGFTAENISGYYLIHDNYTDTWTAEFVFESDFTEAGYTGDIGTGPEDNGGGLTGRTVSGNFANGGSVLDDGVRLGAGKQVATRRTTVTRTTSPSWSIKWVGGLIPIVTINSGSTVTTTTEDETIIRGARITSENASGALPPPK